ncbi:MAG: PTS sugar transporter subunit IIA [Liquorilactobacillus nagelii]|uniref:BglG family transcription antiterminator n=2 Tax=Liquorilactobacillus nagelii TaxID=82688 RepID=UPI0039E930CB
MNDRLRMLMMQLSNEKWQTAQQLAQQLEVTPRTIRSYVAKLKENGVLLQASHTKGYRLQNQADSQFLNEISIGPEARRREFLVALLHHGSIDYYQFALKHHVEDTTVAKDISLLNRKLSSYAAKISVKNYVAGLEANEEQVRQILLDQLYQESATAGFNVQALSHYFHFQFNYDELTQFIHQQLKQNDLVLNDYNFTNFVFHLLVAIDRNQKLGKTIQPEMQASNQSQKVISVLVIWLRERYGLSLLIEDQHYLTLLLDNTAQISWKNHESIRKLAIMVNEILQEINLRYELNLNDEHFVDRLLLHVANLVNRGHCSQLLRHQIPLVHHIKQTYPLIYDVAVFFVSQLAKKIDLALESDTEIALIAIHFGLYIEDSLINSDTLTISLISPGYQELRQKIANKISSSYGKRVVVKTYSDDQRVDKSGLVLTTDPTIQRPGYLLVSNFFNSRDRANVTDKIDHYLQKKSDLRFEYFLSKCLSEEHFQISRSFADKKSFIEQRGNDLLKTGYIEADFLGDVLKRESMSSTNMLNGVAIPHSLQIGANRSIIDITIFPSGVVWDPNAAPVEIVVLSCIKSSDQAIFGDFMDHLVKITSNSKLFNRLKESRSFNDFLHELRTISK